MLPKASLLEQGNPSAPSGFQRGRAIPVLARAPPWRPEAVSRLRPHSFCPGDQFRRCSSM